MNNLITNYIYRQVAEKKLSKAEAKDMLLQLMEEKQCDIAIIGIAGKYPKSADVMQLWENLKNGENCIDYPSKARREVWKDFYPSRFQKGKTVEEVFNLRGYMEEIDKFDAGFFGISPKEVKFMEPSQRMFLQTAYEALEDAGQNCEQLQGKNISIFVGQDNQNGHDYAKISDTTDQMAMTGLYPALLSNRLAYFLDLKGACVMVDTACSSGLISIMQAIHTLKQDESEMAIAGGVYVRSDLFRNDKDPMNMILTETGVVRTFDDDANGTVAAEGVGVVVLKKLSKALEDGDHVYAVIKGGAVNNDGKSSAITAPNAEAQADVLVKAWKNAGIRPENLSYIEAHGTGTVIGDPIEIRALNQAFSRYTDRYQFCGIGSVKSNLGHTASSAGIAAVIKMVLALQYRILPGSLNFEKPNHYVDFLHSAVYVNDQTRKWETPEGVPRCCGVSSFGFSGTNCHLILEEAKAPKTDVPEQKQNTIFTLSAKTPAILEDYIGRFCDFLSDQEADAFRSICYTTNAGKRQMECRIAVLCSGLQELTYYLQELKKHGVRDIPGHVKYGMHKMVSDRKKERTAGERTNMELEAFTRELTLRMKNDGDYQNGELGEIASLYVQGGKIDWEAYYGTTKYHRVKVPAYPFERVSYWHSPKNMEQQMESTDTEERKLNYPLHIKKQLCDSIHEDIYAVDFQVEKHWVVNEHKIGNRYIIPGTAYIDTLYQLAGQYFEKGAALQFENLCFSRPVYLEEGNAQELQLIIGKSEEGRSFPFTFTSRNGEGEKWCLNLDGRIAVVSGTEENHKGSIEIEEIKSRCNRKSSQYESYQKAFQNMEVQMGQRWQETIQSVNIGENELLVHVSLPEKFYRDKDDYELHPALLDNAVNAAITSVGKGVYLPYSYDKLVFYEEFPTDYYSHITFCGKMQEDADSRSMNIEFMDSEGKILGEAQGYVIKKAESPKVEKAVLYHELRWAKQPQRPLDTEYSEKDIVLFAEDTRKNAAMAEVLRSYGKNITTVWLKDAESAGLKTCVVRNRKADYQKILQPFQKQEIQIVYLPAQEDLADTQFENEGYDRNRKGIFTIKILLDAIEEMKWKKELQITFCTHHAIAISEREKIENFDTTALYSVAKTIPFEYPFITCRGIDVDDITKPEVLVSEIVAQDSHVNCVLRENQRYREELCKAAWMEQEEEQIHLKEEGCYLITGGLGGVAKKFAEFLTAKTKVNLVLIGRKGIHGEDKSWNADLTKQFPRTEQTKSRICYYSCDITDFCELENCMQQVKLQFGKINGVLHAAGVQGKGFLRNLSEEDMLEVIKPKILGTNNLRKLFHNQTLDFFVLFSSATTLFGGHGNSDYVYANAYLDALKGCPCGTVKMQTINWTGFRDVGMFARSERKEDSIFLSMDTETGFRALGRFINSKKNQVVAGRLNEEKLAGYTEDEMPLHLAEKEVWKASSKQDMPSGQQAGSTCELCGKLTEKYTKTEETIAQVYAKVLNIDKIDIYVSFKELGGDSISGAELVKEIGKQYPGKIGISDIFSYSSVSELAEYIEKENAEDVTEENAEEKQMKDMFKNLENGEITVENGLQMLNDLLKRG